MDFKFRLKKKFNDGIWWAGAIGLLLLSQTRIELLLYLFQETWLGSFFHPTLLEKDAITIATIITPVRGIVFLCSLIALANPIFQNIRESEVVRNSQIKSHHILQTIFLFLVMCIIFSPGRING